MTLEAGNRNGAKARAQCVLRIERYVQSEREYAVGAVADASEKAFFASLFSSLMECLATIRRNVETGRVFPDVPLALSPADQVQPGGGAPGPNRRYRVGFLATTGDPVHWGHIYRALKDSADLELDTVILQVLGDHPHKPAKQLKHMRHAIAREVVLPLYPLIRYTPLGFDSLGIGEQQAMEFALLNRASDIEIFFLCGSDTAGVAMRNIRSCNQLLLADAGGLQLPQMKAVIYKNPGPGTLEEQGQDCCVVRSHPRSTPLMCRGMELSSWLFRTHPDLPLLPRGAHDFIRRRNLYRHVSASVRQEIATEIVLCSFLTPQLHERIERRFEGLEDVPPLVPHGRPGKIGNLDGTRVTLMPCAGKESSLVPLMRAGKPTVLLGIGLCGAFQSRLHSGDIILPTVAIRGEGITDYWADGRLPAVPDAEILFLLRDAAHQLRKSFSIGPLFTTASLVHEWPVAERFGPVGVLGIEMELALFWTLAMMHRKRAASVYVVSDNVAMREDILATGIEETAALEHGVDTAVSIVSRTIADIVGRGETVRDEI